MGYGATGVMCQVSCVRSQVSCLMVTAKNAIYVSVHKGRFTELTSHHQFFGADIEGQIHQQLQHQLRDLGLAARHKLHEPLYAAGFHFDHNVLVPLIHT